MATEKTEVVIVGAGASGSTYAAVLAKAGVEPNNGLGDLLAKVAALPEADRTAITDGLKHLLADTYTLYLMTHNFHWNVTGPMFNTLHVMFMQQYTEQWNALDLIAAESTFGRTGPVGSSLTPSAFGLPGPSPPGAAWSAGSSRFPWWEVPCGCSPSPASAGFSAPCSPTASRLRWPAGVRIACRWSRTAPVARSRCGRTCVES